MRKCQRYRKAGQGGKDYKGVSNTTMTTAMVLHPLFH